jgi:hypothetical protein
MRRLPVFLSLAILVMVASPLMGRHTAAQDATPATSAAPGFVSLFDGTQESFAAWHTAGPGRFELVDGSISTGSSTEEFAELGLLYYAPRTFADFVLRVEFRVTDPADNSGVFVRFRDPVSPIPPEELSGPESDRLYPNRDSYAVNGMWIAQDTGFEVQIDDSAADTDDPTGVIYDIPVGGDSGQQDFQRGQALVPGEWNDLEIEVVGDTYTVRLNGQQTTSFTNSEPGRGKSPSDDPLFGYIGIQTYPFSPGQVDFRNIRIQELPPAREAATPMP